MEAVMSRLAVRLTRSALVALFILVGSAALAWDAGAETLAVIPWDQPDAAALAPLQKECTLLAHNQDLALLLLPSGYTLPATLTVEVTILEPIRAEGDYYLFQVEQPRAARFAGESDVLLTNGHTVVLWSRETPRLTEASRAAMRGLVQPVRVSLTPKVWPQAAAAPSRGRTTFDPLVDQMVADVSQVQYVAKWQALDDYETRYYNTTQNTNASQWMYNTFVSYGLQAQFQTFSYNGTRRNVVGILPGLVHPEQVVYITGHFDSTSEDPQNHAPGADDNASGTTAFLEAARVLSQYAFEYTIKFVGFNCEEQGDLGSDAYCDYIQAQGEDVIADFNFDMIAYAGNDPLPPDLVIYTNTASLAFANVLRDACLEYEPTNLEPVVRVEELSGSDHYSFWTHGYAAITGIEDEAWADDFCPWYHTSNDRIERYPQDYPTNVTRAAIAAVAQTAVPLQPNTPYLVLDAALIDDDASGASHGNGNGVLEYGETIELKTTLRNVGAQNGVNVTGRLLTDDPYINVTTALVSFGTILAGGGTATNASPFVFSIAPSVPDDHPINFRIAVNAPPDTLDLQLRAYAPGLGVVAFEVDDATGGDGDGIPEPGEDLTLTITVQNTGSTAVTGVSGALAGSGFVTADPTPRSFGDLPAQAIATAGPYAVSIDAACPQYYAAAMALQLTGSNAYAMSAGFILQVGEIFRDDMEAGDLSWTHYSGGSGFGDQWHLETYRNHTYGGTTSWKCGGAGSASYNDLLYAVLESTPFTLPPSGQLTFWHWINAETSSSYPDHCYDGGLVQISINGGAWQTITPQGGYPYLIRAGGTPGPFPAETPVFSGVSDWQREVFDLGGYEGSARIRFAFGSDGSTTREGWYVDDVEVTLQFSDAGEPEITRALQLHPAGPNPSTGGSELRLELPRAGEVELRVYDASGRRVRAIHAGRRAAGHQSIAWDGLSDAGTPVAAGVYWMRVLAGGEERGARVVVVR
jgi:hypothetical protein